MATANTDIERKFPNSAYQFIEMLSGVDWYMLSVYLDVPTHERDEIQRLHGSRGTLMCLVKVHEYFEKKGKIPTWKAIATALEKIGENALADKIKGMLEHGPATEGDGANFDQFSDVLSTIPHWYTLGIFLHVPSHELNNIKKHHNNDGSKICLVKLYEWLATKNRVPSWWLIYDILLRMNEGAIAEEVNSRFLKQSPLSQHSETFADDPPIDDDSPTATPTPFKQPTTSPVTYVPESVSQKFHALDEDFTCLVVSIKKAFKSSNINLGEVQDLIHEHLKLPPLPETETTVDSIFTLLQPHYCLLKIHILSFLIRKFLSVNDALLQEKEKYELKLDEFKKSMEIKSFVKLLKSRNPQPVIPGKAVGIVTLKVREFWGEITIKKFENAILLILKKLYEFAAQITVDEGCYRISWILPEQLLHYRWSQDDEVTMGIIGFISIDIISNYKEHFIFPFGCEVIEAAMLQALELNNTTAIAILSMMQKDHRTLDLAAHQAMISLIGEELRRQGDKYEQAISRNVLLGELVLEAFREVDHDRRSVLAEVFHKVAQGLDKMELEAGDCLIL